MLRGLINDHIVNLRDCLLISSSLLVSLSAGFSVYALSGKKTDVRIRAMLAFSVLALIFLLCPVTASVFRMAVGTYYDSQDMWTVLPLIPLGAIMSASLFDELYSREKKISCLAVIFFACAVLVCGSLGGARGNASGRYETASPYEIETADMITDNGLVPADSVIIASDSMMAYIRGTYPAVRTLYGRDMWDGRLTKNRYGTYEQAVSDIHDDMVRIYNGEYVLAEELSARAFDAGVSFIVFPGEVSEERLNGEGYITTRIVSSDGVSFILVCPGEKTSDGEE
ncbi:MAG: hypothetical protein K6F65_00200 [Lachnospiraceae bacterium]|nr:hypothetical protein [Lachnospiraceae bacterium]